MECEDREEIFWCFPSGVEGIGNFPSGVFNLSGFPNSDRTENVYFSGCREDREVEGSSILFLTIPL